MELMRRKDVPVELTWMRQPHYYMQLYSYVYSAGLTIGTQMCRRIETEEMDNQGGRS